MSNLSKFLIVAALPLALGFGAAGCTANAGQPKQSDAGGPLRCEIAVQSSGGMVALQGVVHADMPVSGSYSFRVTGAGSGGGSNIEQGGGFTAGPDGAASLGNVMLSSGAYDVTLEVNANGTSVTCSERVGGT